MNIQVNDVVHIKGDDPRNRYLVKDVLEGANGMKVKLHGKSGYCDMGGLVFVKRK